MTRLGIFVGENNWTFFNEIFEDLSLHYFTHVFNPKTYNFPVFSGRLNSWYYQRRFQSVLSSNDVCFFEWASDLLVAASHMPKYAPIITRLHSFELADWAHYINWDRVDKVVLVSKAMHSKFIAQYPGQADKAILINNAIPVNKYFPVERPFEFSIGMLCNLKPIKRVYEIILLVKELRDQGYKLILHIGGSPSNDNFQDRYYVAMRRLVVKLNLLDSVVFYGYVNDPAAWLQKIDIFISNSYWEGMQTALLEAMATGCYCLAHFWDGIEEVLPSDNIYVTNNDLIRKLIAYSRLSAHEHIVRKIQMVEIVHQKFNIEDKKALFHEVINSLC